LTLQAPKKGVKAAVAAPKKKLGTIKVCFKVLGGMDE